MRDELRPQHGAHFFPDAVFVPVIKYARAFPTCFPTIPEVRSHHPGECPPVVAIHGLAQAAEESLECDVAALVRQFRFRLLGLVFLFPKSAAAAKREGKQERERKCE